MANTQHDSSGFTTWSWAKEQVAAIVRGMWPFFAWGVVAAIVMWENPYGAAFFGPHMETHEQVVSVLGIPLMLWGWYRVYTRSKERDE